MFKKFKKTTPLNFILLLTITVLVINACHFGNKHHEDIFSEGTIEIDKMLELFESDSLLIPLSPLLLDFYPCSQCHADLELNTTRREMIEMHDDIVFEHDSKNRWCFDCHDVEVRDSLKLASGKLLSFEQSFKLCGQCHGPKYRDWKLGIHGKRTGYWNGKKQYLLCVHCHNPHSPKIKSITPLPAPVKPDEYYLKTKTDSINQIHYEK